MLFRDVDPGCPDGVGAHREDEVTPYGLAPVRFEFQVCPESSPIVLMFYHSASRSGNPRLSGVARCLSYLQLYVIVPCITDDRFRGVVGLEGRCRNQVADRPACLCLCEELETIMFVWPLVEAVIWHCNVLDRFAPAGDGDL